MGGSRVGGSSNYSNIVAMASGIGISNWESSSEMADSVSLRVSLCLTLAIVSSISISKSSIARVSMDGRSSNNTGVSMDGGRSNNTGVSIGSGGSNNLVSISKMSNTSTSNMTCISMVANGTKSANNNVRIVNTSYNTAIGESRCNLANCVGITVNFDSGEGQKALGGRKFLIRK